MFLAHRVEVQILSALLYGDHRLTVRTPPCDGGNMAERVFSAKATLPQLPVFA